MRMKKEILCFDGLEYPVSFLFKKKRSVSVSFDEENQIFIFSLPLYMKAMSRENLVCRYKSLFDHVGARVKKRNAKNMGQRDYDGEYIYLFGEKFYVGAISKNEIENFLRKRGLPYLESRVRYYEGVMNIPKPYKVRMRDMKTRYGVNSSQTYSVTFTNHLVCYSPAIIDSVVVHELCHHFERNHQKGFYDLVYRYDNDYKIQHAKLRKGIHS